MSVIKEILNEEKIYTVPLKFGIAFPRIPFSFDVTEKYQIETVKKAEKSGGVIFLVTEEEYEGDHPEKKSDLFEIGAIAIIHHLVDLPDGSCRVLCEANDRGILKEYFYDEEGVSSLVIRKRLEEDLFGPKIEAAMKEVRDQFIKFTSVVTGISKDLVTAVNVITEPSLFADFVGCNVLYNLNDKKEVLAEFEVLKRLELVSYLLEKETGIRKIEKEIHEKVMGQFESDQRDRFLREEMRVIQNELGEEDDEIAEYEKKFGEMDLPKEVHDKIFSEISKLGKMPYSSAEASVVRNWLDICLEIPFGKKTDDNLDISAVKKQLDLDHDGLDEVKDRILEFLAVEKLTPDASRQILCLYGPPGTGKTSICASIAKALGREYVRVSLGGIRDEADIRGHRKTYIASMPGRIIEGLQRAKSMNPLMLLDEVDKMTSNMQGDPASALLEVLDSEQNVAFRDHFLEMPVDLSNVMFICTANNLGTVPRPLLDRMEVVELQIYSRSEKYDIARHHLIPKQLVRSGLTSKDVTVTKGGLYAIIDKYTREAGVRNLEREISSVFRKVALERINGKNEKVTITDKNIEKYLGPEKIRPEEKDPTNEIGTANGLAYTEVGGDTLKIETAVMPGDGKLQLTGSLGNVMTESAKAAISYIRSRSEKLGVDSDFYKTKDIHIHVPEGAVPKDGPSAGVTIMTALVSGLTGIPTRHDTAMTGEITLRGKVLPIGGLREKSMAAYTAGMKRVLIPKGNMPDLEKCDPLVVKGIEFIPCSNADDVLREALVQKKAKRKNDGKRKSGEGKRAQ